MKIDMFSIQRCQRANVSISRAGDSRVHKQWCRASQSSGGEVKTVKVTIKQPLGIVLAEDVENNCIFVEEIEPGSNAQEHDVTVGDVLVGCSGVVLKEAKLSGSFEKEGYGQRPYDNWETVWVDARGLQYETVMSALRSNNPRWGINTITLELQKVSS